MNLKKLATPALAAALAATAVAYYGYDTSFMNAAQANPLTSEPAVAAVTGLPDFTALVSRASPAVVNISVTRATPASRNEMNPLDPDNPYREFFRRFGPQMPEGEGPIARSGGSGFIVSPDGRVLTNAHVVADADEVTVQMSDKREFTAKVLGIDEQSDVAVLKIDARNLPTLQIGDPERLRAGEWVIAIGSPFGFDNTVSAGVVSAKTRTLPNGGYVPFIQTDVAINPGNSGGPLLNLAGEVVGINSQIYSQSGGYMGLSFAIPIDLAMGIEAQLVEHGKVTRGRLGVAVQSLNQDLAQSFNLPSPRGALVSQVESGMPAARAGIRAGDVILKLDGAEIEDSAMLSRLIAAKKPGDEVTVEVLREGRRQRIDVSLGVAPDAGLASADSPVAADPGRLGVVVREAPADGGERRGVFVEAVSGAAARAGIREGDVILALNSAAISSAEQLRSLVAKAPDHIALLVQRENAEIYVPVRLG